MLIGGWIIARAGQQQRAIPQDVPRVELRHGRQRRAVDVAGRALEVLVADGKVALVVTGGETDVCVLATVLGAIDLGYHVYLPLDALYGSADPTHDAMLEIYKSRFQAQLTTTSVAEFFQLLQDGEL